MTTESAHSVQTMGNPCMLVGRGLERNREERRRGEEGKEWKECRGGNWGRGLRGEGNKFPGKTEPLLACLYCLHTEIKSLVMLRCRQLIVSGCVQHKEVS